MCDAQAVWRRDRLREFGRRLAAIPIGLAFLPLAIRVIDYLERHPDEHVAIGFAIGSVWIVAALVGIAGLALGYWGWARHRRKSVFGTKRPTGAARAWSGRLATAFGVTLALGLIGNTILYGRRGRRGIAAMFPALGEGQTLAFMIAVALMAVVVIIAPWIHAWANYVYLRLRPSLVTALAGTDDGPESLRVLYRPSFGFNGEMTVRVDGKKRGVLSSGGALGLYLASGDHRVTTRFAGAFGDVDRDAHLRTSPGASIDIVASSGLVWAIGKARYKAEREFRLQRPDLSSFLAIPDLFAGKRRRPPAELSE